MSIYQEGLCGPNQPSVTTIALGGTGGCRVGGGERHVNIHVKIYISGDRTDGSSVYVKVREEKFKTGEGEITT